MVISVEIVDMEFTDAWSGDWCPNGKQKRFDQSVFSDLFEKPPIRKVMRRV